MRAVGPLVRTARCPAPRPNSASEAVAVGRLVCWMGAPMVGGTGMSGISGLKTPETPFSTPLQASPKYPRLVPGRMEVGSRKNRWVPELVAKPDIEEAPELTPFSIDLAALLADRAPDLTALLTLPNIMP